MSSPIDEGAGNVTPGNRIAVAGLVFTGLYLASYFAVRGLPQAEWSDDDAGDDIEAHIGSAVAGQPFGDREQAHDARFLLVPTLSQGSRIGQADNVFPIRERDVVMMVKADTGLELHGVPIPN